MSGSGVSYSRGSPTFVPPTNPNNSSGQSLRPSLCLPSFGDLLDQFASPEVVPSTISRSMQRCSEPRYPFLSGINAPSPFVPGSVFQSVIRRKNSFWWAKFNYFTSVGLDAGTGFAIIVMFFALAVSSFHPFRISLADKNPSSRSTGKYLSTGGAAGYGWGVS